MLFELSSIKWLFRQATQYVSGQNKTDERLPNLGQRDSDMCLLGYALLERTPALLTPVHGISDA
jgi:hypothetical protein